MKNHLAQIENVWWDNGRNQMIFVRNNSYPNKIKEKRIEIPDLLLFLLIKFSFMRRVKDYRERRNGRTYIPLAVSLRMPSNRSIRKPRYCSSEPRADGMQRVPAAGPIRHCRCGFDRKHLLKNIAVLFKIWKSRRMARKIISDFRPMAAVGVGGYASGPTLNVAEAMESLH